MDKNCLHDWNGGEDIAVNRAARRMTAACAGDREVCVYKAGRAINRLKDGRRDAGLLTLPYERTNRN
jgi:hypothetical protein